MTLYILVKQLLHRPIKNCFNFNNRLNSLTGVGFLLIYTGAPLRTFADCISETVNHTVKTKEKISIGLKWPLVTTTKTQKLAISLKIR